MSDPFNLIILFDGFVIQISELNCKHLILWNKSDRQKGATTVCGGSDHAGNTP